MMICC